MPETSSSSAPATGETVDRSKPLKKWGGRLFGVGFGLLLAWLLLEVMLRVLFFSLPPDLQLVLDEVRITPFTDRKMLPDPIWQPDTEYLMIQRPVTDYEQFGSAEVRFTVTTETLWGSRAAFRTQQALVDQYVDGVVVGDSFTFCLTDNSECWVQQLSDQTNRNLINLGIVSTGSISHLNVLRNFGLPLEPPLVIWQWFGNDANEDYGMAQMRGETSVESTDPPPPIPDTTWWDRHSAVYVLLNYYWGSESQFESSLQFHDEEYAERGAIALGFGKPYLWNAFDTSLPQNEYGWERTQDAIREGRDLVEGYGGEFVIVLIPVKELVYRDMAEPLIGAEHYALLETNYTQMLDFCAAEELACFDPLPVLREYTGEEQLYYTTDMHLNPRGNEVLATALAEWLERDNRAN